MPIRFGADALGGAVNLVTDDDVKGTHTSASYQAGSFGTQRVALGARHLHEPSGLFTRAGGRQKFFRGWEVGLRASKDTVPTQLLHSLALTYLIPGDPATLSFTAEVQNLTDRPAFDFFGVQRPGRAFYFKTTAEF